ncbi:vWA domain-containing protein [Paenibacillus elgii]
MNSPVRVDAHNKIRDHGPPDVYPHTSIGAGLQAAANVYNTSPNAAHFEIKATIVFTDGFEDRAPFIADVEQLINERVYAVGIADAANVRNDILRALANNSGGYMLVTGSLAQDDEFLIEKYFIQIAAGVMNRDIVRDPKGWVLPGQIARVPFSITRSDIDFDAIALSRTPQYVVIGLETPDGTIVNQTQVPVGSYRPGITSTSMRITLPLVLDGKEYWEGEWNLLLAEQRGPSILELSNGAALPFHALVHARSNLNMRAYIDQSASNPGAEIHLRAVITEYGQPLETHPKVKATMTRPDQTTVELLLNETDYGQFEISTIGLQSGVYRFYIQATGLSSRGQAFSREQLFTIIVGQAPRDSGNTQPDSESTTLCEFLKCLFSKGVITERLDRKLEEIGIDLPQLRHCISGICSEKKPD